MIAAVFTRHEVLFAIDSFPVPACERARGERCRKVRGKEYYGYIAAKRRFLYGWRLHLVVTSTGIPVNVVLMPASVSDLSPVHELLLGLPAGSCADGDKAYNSQLDDAWS